MAELMASLSDINGHLPPNIQIDNVVDVSLQVDAQRLIVGQLVTTFPPATIRTWSSPDATPDQIRTIAGRLIASKYYAQLVSGESADEYPNYAVMLYNQAIGLLADIRSGKTTVVDSEGNPIAGVDVDSDPQNDMYPNDTAQAAYFTNARIIVSS